MHLACPVLPSIWDNCHSLFRKVGTVVPVCLDVGTLDGTIVPNRIVAVCLGPYTISISQLIDDSMKCETKLRYLLPEDPRL